MRKLVAVCCAVPVVALAVPAVADVALAPQLITPDTAQELYFGSVSGDGTRAYFWTRESLVGADGDASADIYERNVAAGGLRLVTDRVQTGPDEAIDVEFSAAPSADGSRVLFATKEQIVDADDDTAQDVYEVTAGGTTLVTDRVKAGPDENLDAASAGMTGDGTSVRILTREALLDADGDSSTDVYLRRNGQLTLISDRVQAGPDEEKDAGGVRTSRDGSRIVITTQEALLADDTDSVSDLYLYDVATGSTTLVSDGPQAGPDSADNLDSTYAIAPNGSRVFFVTREALLPEDTDGTTWMDVFEYRVSDGATTMVSDRVLPGPDGPNHAGITFSGGRPLSDDGTHVLFSTSENLVAEDTDSEAGTYFDTYERVDGTTTRLVSDRVQAGSDENLNAFPHGISRDGSRIVFVTFEQILSQDMDSSQDVYLREDGTTTTMLSDRVPAGTTSGFNISTAYVNPDVTRVFFSTQDPLVAEDGDFASDLYERTVDGGVTTLLTDRVKAGPDENQPLQAVAHSEDSSRVFFSIDEQLVDGDGDAVRDVYLANSPPLPDPDPDPDPTAEPTAEPTVVPTPVPTATPGPPVKPPPVVTPPPALKPADVVKLPSARRCVSRRKFRIKLRRPGGTTISQATVFINGKRKKTFKGRAIRPTVDLRGLPKGRITVKIVIKTADGRTAKLTRRYRTCVPRRR